MDYRALLAEVKRSENPNRPTAETAKSPLSSVSAVPHAGDSEKSEAPAGGFVGFGSSPSRGFESPNRAIDKALEIERRLGADEVRVCLHDGRLHYVRGDREPPVTAEHNRLVCEYEAELMALMMYRQRLDEAGNAVVDEPPRPLEPKEKAAIARRLRTEYQSDDVAIRETLELCEQVPPHREYLLAKASEGGQ